MQLVKVGSNLRQYGSEYKGPHIPTALILKPGKQDKQRPFAILCVLQRGLRGTQVFWAKLK